MRLSALGGVIISFARFSFSLQNIFVCYNGLQICGRGGIWTLNPCGIRFWAVRVFQFRHSPTENTKCPFSYLNPPSLQELYPSRILNTEYSRSCEASSFRSHLAGCASEAHAYSSSAIRPRFHTSKNFQKKKLSLPQQQHDMINCYLKWQKNSNALKKTLFAKNAV